MIVNGTDLYVWISTELVAYSTSYTLSVEQETRPGTNKGSGIWRKALPGMLNITGSVDGLYVFAGSYATLLARVMSRTPVRLYFGQKDSVSGLLDTTTEFMSGDFLITSLEITASDAENATYSASFTYYDSFGTVSGLTPPTVVTGRAIGATTTTVGLNGNVTSDGGSVVTDRGFVWNINGNPTLADNSFSDGTGTGTYSEVITGLTPGTPYFYRAYATNAAGTSYGTQATFTTVAEAVPSYFWIAPNGSDTTGDGEFNTPWLTLAHAISQVTTGNTINLKVGTYNIGTQISVPAGVSIRGQGNKSILVLTWTTASSSQGCIQFSSYPTEGTNGNQSISNLYIDGDLTGTTGIVVYCRSNVIIHDITMVDFDQCGIHFRGNAGSVEATTKATGNQIYNCTINNCSTRGAVSNGLIRISSQSGMLIHDNILVQTGRAQGSNGNIINAVGGGSETNSGFNDGVKYYRNKSYKPYSEGAAWNFHIESWDATGWEVYDNDFYGGGCHIDIGGYYNTKGDYDYSFYIHGNRFVQDVVQPNNATIQTIGIDVESNTSDVIITGNYFKNLQFGIYHSLNLSRSQNNILVSYNVFESIGLTDNIWAGPIMIASEGTAPAYTNLYYDNNTMTASTAYNVGAGITFNLYAGTADARIRNNIIKGFMRPLWVAATTNPDTVYYQNNHSNNTSDAIYYSAGRAITELISADNQTGDPLFVGAADFHLQAGSPCINQGIDIGLTTDYDNQTVSSPPEIGAYEYV